MSTGGASFDETANHSRRFLTFTLDDRRFAVAAEAVIEVAGVPPLVRMPRAPRALLGIVNWRGAVVPFVSLRSMLSGFNDGEDAKGSRAIVLDRKDPVGVLVDRMESLVEVDHDAIFQSLLDPAIGADFWTLGAFTTGDDGVSIPIIDISRYLVATFPQRAPTGRGIASRSLDKTASAIAGDVTKSSLVIFDVAGQEFALDLETVREILEPPDRVASTPHADEVILGLINYRERSLPLLSLRALLGFPMTDRPCARGKVIVATVGGAPLGLLADHARAIVSVDPARIDTVPPVLSARFGAESRLRAVWRPDHGRGVVGILDVARLFRDDVMERLGRDAFDVESEPDISAVSDERKFVVFGLGDDEFAIAIEAIDEVALAPDHLTPVPGAPETLLGVTRFRGDVLPVVHAGERFSQRKRGRRTSSLLLILSDDGNRAGILVDTVSAPLTVATVAIEPAPILTDDVSRLVTGVIRLGEDRKVILVVEPRELLMGIEGHAVGDAFGSRDFLA